MARQIHISTTYSNFIGIELLVAEIFDLEVLPISDY